MSEEAPTSTSGKHSRAEDEPGESQAKKQRLEDEGEGGGPCTSSTDAVASGSGAGDKLKGEGVMGEGVTSESDEEYRAGGWDSDEEGLSGGEREEDAESSDISAEEEEEEEEEGEGSNILCGLEVYLKEVNSGKYRLFHQQNGRELKMLVSEEAVASAKKVSKEKQEAGLIAVLVAQKVETTKDDEDEIIVYAESLAAADKDYPYYDGEEMENQPNDESSVLLQGNTLVVIQVEGMEAVFATGDFSEDQHEA